MCGTAKDRNFVLGLGTTDAKGELAPSEPVRGYLHLSKRGDACKREELARVCRQIAARCCIGHRRRLMSLSYSHSGHLTARCDASEIDTIRAVASRLAIHTWLRCAALSQQGESWSLAGSWWKRSLCDLVMGELRLCFGFGGAHA